MKWFDFLVHGGPLSRTAQAWLKVGVACALWLVLGWGTAAHGQTAPIPQSADSSVSIGFCAVGTQVATVNPATDCQLPKRPKHAAQSGVVQQLVHLQLTQTSPSTDQPDWLQGMVSLRVMPYYLHHIQVLSWQAGQWVLAAEGGAHWGGHHPSATLGGHQFDLATTGEHTEWLLVVTSPGFSHLAIALDPDWLGSSLHELLIAVHVGMLLLLFALTLAAWAARPSGLYSKLALLVGLILLNVLIGSGMWFKLWPHASVHVWGYLVFNASIAARIAAMTLLFAAVIGSYNNRRSYALANQVLYVAALLVMSLFVIDMAHLGWPLLGLLLLMGLLAPLWGVVSSPNMPHLLKWSLVGAVALYISLNMLGALIVLNNTAQSQLPVYLTRVTDLALPLAMFALVLVRHRVNDQALEAAQGRIRNQEQALHTERRVNQEKRLLLDMLSHEVKNTLTAIQFAVGSLAQTLTTPHNQRRLSNIAESVDSIDEIIERCNLANGLDERSITPHMDAVDLAQLVQGLVQLSPEAQRYQLECPAQGAVATTDRYLLKVVVSNLLDNARKYSPVGTLVHVWVCRSSAEPGTWCIGVHNHRHAHVALDAQRLFERYYRHESAQHQRGSGLGLSLSRDICSLMGAQLSCTLYDDSIEFEVTLGTS